MASVRTGSGFGLGKLHGAWAAGDAAKMTAEDLLKFRGQGETHDMVSGVVSSQHVLGPEQLVSAIRNANLEPCQLNSSPVPSKISRVLFPLLCLDLVSIGPAMLYTGAMPEDCYTISFVMENPGVGQSFNFSTEYRGGGYMAFFPPGGELYAMCPEGCKDAVLTIPGEVFLAAVDLHFPEMPGDLLKEGGAMWVGSYEQRQIRDLLGAIEKVVESGGEGLEKNGLCRQLESDLLGRYLSAMRDACAQKLKKQTQRVANRHRRFRHVRDFISDHLHQPIYLDDLCREAGLSAGGTENLFRDFLGIGPIAFLRYQRLHNARHTLLREERLSGVVKNAALTSGFRHLGRFSHEYRKFFGEMPSETVDRFG